MSNMSYCRFENTTDDIEDCIEALNDNDWDLTTMMENASSKHEARAMKRFVNLCIDVAEGVDRADPFLT